MIIEHNISSFTILSTDTLFNALNKIDKNRRRFVLIVTESGKLEGVLTDGDIRRWLMLESNEDLNVSVSTISNKNYISLPIESLHNEIKSMFNEQLDAIPLTDQHHKLIAIALKQSIEFKIDERIINDNNPAYIIAEIGNNHNGDIQLAKQLVDLAIESGADCIKFQMRNFNDLYEKDDKSADLGDQYTFDLLRRFQLSNEELIEIFDYCKYKGKTPLCTPWDLDSLAILEKYGMQVYKIASADLTNTELLKAVIDTGKPIICSTGMSTEEEIRQAIDLFNKSCSQFILLHCNSTYPTPYRDVNLKYLSHLKSLTGGVVGYSGHERGYLVPVLAVALGAKIIEKHFTIDKTMEGNDHKISLLPAEFKEMVKQIRLGEEVLGKESDRTISQGESMNREILAKSLVINQTLKVGETITYNMIEIKSPGHGVQPYHIDELVGKKALRNFIAGDCFYESDLKESLLKPRKYSFKRPFGIPVRYHDYQSLVSETNVDFVEFHLSYKDLELKLEDIFCEVSQIGLAVHSPELFVGDHILDLCSSDDMYRNLSIKNLQRVVNITRELKKYFIATENPVIVTNVGGFSTSGFLPKENRQDMYNKAAEALASVDSNGVEIIIQTMPPFPWHFGGQSYHNLFVDPYEIYDFYKKTGYRICLDISHSQMACSYNNWVLEDFIKIIAKSVAHLHIVDALGIDGEGVQIGKGDINFVQLGKILDNLVPQAPFIPEIWQGHKQNGSGFWAGLEFLEKYL